MRRELRAALAVVLALLGGMSLIAAMVPGLTPAAGAADPSATTSADPSASPSSAPSTTPRTITDAQLRWGVNNESNNVAYFGFNFLAAGKLPNKGANHSVTASEWQQRAGAVSIEKYSAAAQRYAAATWAGLRTDSAGASITGPTSGRFSAHQVVIDGGTGTVDPAAGTAQIRWSGSFTVVYYGGYSYFYVSNPVLTVSGGRGVVTATLGGFGSSQANTSIWAPLPDAAVTLADLGPVSLGALTDQGGLTLDPAYRGVEVTLPAGTAAQVRTGADWGAFPQSFVDYQTQTGLSSFWYSSGVALDRNKVAAPITVSLEASSPVTAKPSAVATPAPVVTNSVTTPPPAPVTVTATTTPYVATGPVPGVVAPVAPTVPAATPVLSTVRPVETVHALRPVAAPTTSEPTWPWLVGGVALLATAALLLLPVGSMSRRTSQRRTTPPGA